MAGLDLGLAWPDGPAHPHVRSASIACSTASPCALVLDLLDRQTPVPMP